MSRSKPAKSKVQTDKVKEKDKHVSVIIDRIKRGKTLFSCVAGFELLVKALDKVVRNIIPEAPDTNVLNTQYGFHRQFVSTVTVGNHSSRFIRKAEKRLVGCHDGARSSQLHLTLHYEKLITEENKI